MKVPVYEQAQVGPQSVALPIANVRPVDDSAIRQGLASLDRGLEQASANVRREEERAIAAETTDSETELTKRVTGELHGDSASGKHGFMSLKGRAAEADGAPVMERIEKHRKEIADGLANEDAKKLFLSRTGKQVEHWRGSVESYVSGERQRADVASLKARADVAIEAMFNAARIGDGATVQNQSIALEGPIQALALSPEDAQRDLAQWRRQTVETQLAAFLDVDRLDVAAALLEDSKGMLGPALAAKYEKEIETRTVAVTAETAADQIIAKAQHAVQSRPFAAPDRSTAEQLLARLPADVQKKAGPIIKERLALLTADQHEAKERFIQDARAAYNRNKAGFFSTPMADRLNDVDAQVYAQLDKASDSELERLERRNRIRGGDVTARREQTAINTVAKNEFLALPVDQQASIDLDGFLVGRGTGPVDGKVNPVPSELKRLQQVARKQVEGGLGVSRESFVSGLKASLQKYAPKPGTSKESRSRAAIWWADHVADGVNAYNLWVDNNPTKKPTAEDIATIRASIIGELPPNPENPESVTESARALSIRGGGAGAPEPPKLVTIPAEERRQIEGALRDKGRVITEDAVQALYRKVHGGR